VTTDSSSLSHELSDDVIALPRMTAAWVGAKLPLKQRHRASRSVSPPPLSPMELRTAFTCLSRSTDPLLLFSHAVLVERSAPRLRCCACVAFIPFTQRQCSIVPVVSPAYVQSADSSSHRRCALDYTVSNYSLYFSSVSSNPSSCSSLSSHSLSTSESCSFLCFPSAFLF
jgi:hypothetical protein